MVHFVVHPHKFVFHIFSEVVCWFYYIIQLHVLLNVCIVYICFVSCLETPDQHFSRGVEEVLGGGPSFDHCLLASGCSGIRFCKRLNIFCFCRNGFV